MRIAPFSVERLAEARRLLVDALPYDRVDVVAEEKLFGGDGARSGSAIGAFDGDRLVGVLALAGRWVKLLAVAPSEQRRGVGSALLAEARASAPRLRIFDHPGNYLSPGLDVRYLAGRAFLEKHGFRVTGEVENIRAPLDANPLVTPDRLAAACARVTADGYTLRRAGAGDRALLDWIGARFAPVWAVEAERALAGPRQSLHAAWRDGEPVAFAAADGNNRGLGWFGPAGTDPAHRGRHLGEALLLACLHDVRGLPEGGVIAWIGPKAFYAKACGAVDDRRFVTMEPATG